MSAYALTIGRMMSSLHGRTYPGEQVALYKFLSDHRESRYQFIIFQRYLGYLHIGGLEKPYPAALAITGRSASHYPSQS
jgi:hypothetical protein